MRVNISTVLLLEDMGANYQVVTELNVTAMPGRDRCLSESPTDGQCCVARNLAAENQFEVNSSYLYGVVDLPVGPNMRQTSVVNNDHPGYLFSMADYAQMGDSALRNSGNPTDQILKMFQFIIGESRFLFAHLLINQFGLHLFFR